MPVPPRRLASPAPPTAPLLPDAGTRPGPQTSLQTSLQTGPRRREDIVGLPTLLLSCGLARAPRARSEAWRAALDDVLSRDAVAARAVGVLPALFVQAALPYRPLTVPGADGSRAEVPARVVRNGALTVTMRAGFRAPVDGEGGAPVCIGLPYGGLARLLLAHVSTQALRSGSPGVALGPSLAAFLRAVSVPASGGAHGRIAYTRDALLRLAHVVITCERVPVTPSVDAGTGTAVTPTAAPAPGGRATMRRAADPTGTPGGEVPIVAPAPLHTAHVVSHALVADRLALWRASAIPAPGLSALGHRALGHRAQVETSVGEICLSEAFFGMLTAHAVPVDLRKLGVLRNRPLAIDFYAWCTHRLHGLARAREGRITVALADLHAQFGTPYLSSAEFARHLRGAAQHVCVLWPALRLEWPTGRLVLHAGPPDVPPLR